MTPAKKPAQPPAFEERLHELESLVEGLESGDLSLEDGIEHFRQGVELLKGLHASLRDADRKVEMLAEVLRKDLAELEGVEEDEDDDDDA